MLVHVLIVAISGVAIARFKIVTVDALNVHDRRLLGPEARSAIVYTAKAFFDDDLEALLVRLIQAHKLLDELRGLLAAQSYPNCLPNRQLEQLTELFLLGLGCRAIRPHRHAVTVMARVELIFSR